MRITTGGYRGCLLNGDFISTILRPPLWGYLMVIPDLIVRHSIAGRTFTALIGAFAPVLVYFLAKKLFGKRTGFVAGLIYALYPEHIAYSHYLWSEVLFGILCLLSVYFFFVFVNNQQKSGHLFLSFFSAGVALITKEFALILFAGLLFTFFSLKPNRALKKAFICCALFILPVVTYSIAISLVTESVIILNDAPVSNFRIAAGMEAHFEYSFEGREDSLCSLISFLKNRKLSETLRSMKEQFYNLWTPNSYPIIRLFSFYKPQNWSYGISQPWPLTILVAGYYILVVIVGIAGLCLVDNKTYLAFSVTSLVCLSLTSTLALLCSRFRLPFMFIFVIYSASLLTNVKSLIGNLKKPIRVITLGLLLALFAHIIYVKWSTLGFWG